MVGYTLGDLLRHIESHFKPGMNWDRLMKGEIELDHVIPKIKFSYANPEDIEFRRCWALENLKPEWRKPNRSKGGKLIGPSQIPLGI